MAIKFQCPSCKVIRSANDRLLGRKISCPECGSEIQLPSREQAEAAKLARREAKLKRAQRERLAAANVAAAPVFSASEPLDSDGDEMSAEEKALAASTASFTRPKPPAGEDMDMTPMVDVTFLLLIFFMITASFSVQKSIQRPAQRPDDPSTQAIEQEEDENRDLVTVQVDEFNAYNIITSDWDRPAGSKQDLIVALGDARAGDSSGNQPTKLIVQAHEDSIHSAVIAALDAGREAQFESFEVSTVEQFD